MQQIDLSAWITSCAALIGIASAIFTAGVAWSRGKLEGRMDSFQAFFTSWRQEDVESRAQFRQALERRMDRMEDRLNEREDNVQ